MSVIGLDLSPTSTGAAHVWRDRTYTTTRVTVRAAGTELQRLRQMRDAVISACRQPGETEPVDLVVVEGLALGQHTARATMRAGLWWLVVDEIDELGWPWVVIPPTCRAKFATGRGNAAKADVIREVARRYPAYTGGEDEADAMALAACGAEHLGYPPVPVPALNRQALTKIVWPEVAR